MPKDGEADGAAAADKSDGGQTFLLSSEGCPGMKPGDTMELKIVAVHDKEYEVAYEPEEKEEGGEQPPEEPPMPQGGEPGMMD